MEESVDKTAMIKDRIIRHMNADHQDSLSFYLRYYTKAKPSEAATAQLVDINTAAMTITRVTEPNGPPRPVVVAIDPPMKSLSEARERLVAMSFESLEGLGMSRWKFEKYPLPTLTGLIYAMVSCTLLAMLMFPDQTLPPGAEARQLFLFDSDKAARFLYMYQREGRSIIMGTAVYNAAMRMRRRLQQHCYTANWAVWATWLVVALLEGPIACRSFDRIVRNMELDSGQKRR